MLFCSALLQSSSFCRLPSNALCTLAGGTLQVPVLGKITSGAKPHDDDKWLANWRLRLRRELISLTKQIYLLYLIVKHEEVPWPAKIAGGCALGYVFSPIQLIPNFIPIIGQSDDILVLYIGMKIVRRFTPPATLKQCEACAELLFNCADRQVAVQMDHRSVISPRDESNAPHTSR